jgi:Lon protease-like protein
MFELPLFPLNTVLFPGMPLPLRIFEERYKLMIRFCIENNQPFGVVLIRQGLEALGRLAEPYEIGCTARIIEVEPLAKGQMNISTLGEKRFRICQLTHATVTWRHG